MMHLYDRASMAHALTLDLDPKLRRLLEVRIAALVTEYGDLTEHTDFVILEAGDTESALVQIVGFSPMVEPIDGKRFGEAEFYPHWDWLADHGGWFELTYSWGSTHAAVVLIPDKEWLMPELLSLCRRYASDGQTVAQK